MFKGFSLNTQNFLDYILLDTLNKLGGCPKQKADEKLAT
jgi:hypothetical protein